jgi:hypothetical protein
MGEKRRQVAALQMDRANLNREIIWSAATCRRFSPIVGYRLTNKVVVRYDHAGDVNEDNRNAGRCVAARRGAVYRFLRLGDVFAIGARKRHTATT